MEARSLASYPAPPIIRTTLVPALAATVSFTTICFTLAAPPLGILALDFQGIGLDLGNGVDGGFYASSSHQTSFVTNLPHDNGHIAGFSIIDIPEPSTFLLLSTGLLGIVGTIRRPIAAQSE